MTRVILIIAVLTPSICFAADPKPEPIRKWVIATYKKLAEVARDNPLTAAEKMWEKVDEVEPDSPIELRAKPQLLNWRDGVLHISIGEPLGWYKLKGVSSVRIDYAHSYYVLVAEEEAEKLRQGEFVIVTAPLKLFVDYSEFRRNHAKTHKVVLTLSVGTGKTATLASDAIELEYGGKKYPVIYDR